MHMASVSGYDQDIFISYAHVDDEPFDAAGPDKSLGWVAALVRHLENCLAREIGRKEDFTLWKDKYNLHGNDALTTEITTKLRQTGTRQISLRSISLIISPAAFSLSKEPRLPTMPCCPTG